MSPLPAPQRPGRIVVLVSHVQIDALPSRLAREVQEVVDAYRTEAVVEVVDRPISDALQFARGLEQARAVDVFICAGATGAWLQRNLASPVVLMRVSGFDILAALHEASAAGRRIGVLSYREASAELEKVSPLLPFDVKQAAYTTLAEAQAAVKRLAAEGCDAIVGSSMVTELAQEAGLAGVLVHSGHSIRQALDDAMALLRSTREDAAKRQRLDTILHHLTDGVLALAQDGTVQSLNPAMEQFLGVSAAWAVGRRIGEVAPGFGLEGALASASPQEGRIVTHGERTLVVNVLPLVEDGVPAGAVLTCQESSAVQRADRRIRSSTRPSSFTAKYKLAHVVGESAAIRNVLRLAEIYSQSDSTVLVTGESGTGKELVAQGIHNASRRSKGPFVAINCAAFPESLLESELFGYEEGAFSGSRKGGKPGLFESAHTGTIFLDEIGDMPISLQTRLLRVLQEREVLRLGSTEPTPVDVRVLTATHYDLRERIAAGAFREDLYYRVSILRLQLPPLRERREDIPAIARHILANVSRRSSLRDPDSVLALLGPLLEAYRWPGNVRELENVVERAALAVAHLPQGTAMSTEQLRAVIPELFAGRDRLERPSNGNEPIPSPLPMRTLARQTEQAQILRTLEECAGSVAEAAKRLGISRSTLWRKLRGSQRRGAPRQTES